jgi:hypothetical protein
MVRVILTVALPADGSGQARLTVSGMRLIDRVLASVPDDVPVVIVGRPAVASTLDITRRNRGRGPPPRSPPGCAEPAPIVVVCAVDMPFAGPLLAPLRRRQALPMQTRDAGSTNDLSPCRLRRTRRRARKSAGFPSATWSRDSVAGRRDLPIQRLGVDTPSALVAARCRTIDNGHTPGGTHGRVDRSSGRELGFRPTLPWTSCSMARDAAHQVTLLSRTCWASPWRGHGPGTPARRSVALQWSRSLR